MKKEDIPQDPSSLANFSKEVYYATDNAGNYVTGLSTGWEVKANALDVAWKDIEQRVAAAKQKVLDKQASPLLYFMELHLMDAGILSAYTGFWQWQIKRHLKPSVFRRLSDKKLSKYAAAFNTGIDEIKTMMH
ncbi:MAG: hypothetical protein H7Y03_06580 [Chitinophagaceae bacterium]|nr:hypothetical protein [Chitinophagaceae bacterium]